MSLLSLPSCCGAGLKLVHQGHLLISAAPSPCCDVLPPAATLPPCLTLGSTVLGPHRPLAKHIGWVLHPPGPETLSRRYFPLFFSTVETLSPRPWEFSMLMGSQDTKLLGSPSLRSLEICQTVFLGWMGARAFLSHAVDRSNPKWRLPRQSQVECSYGATLRTTAYFEPFCTCFHGQWDLFPPKTMALEVPLS